MQQKSGGKEIKYLIIWRGWYFKECVNQHFEQNLGVGGKRIIKNIDTGCGEVYIWISLCGSKESDIIFDNRWHYIDILEVISCLNKVNIKNVSIIFPVFEV